LNPRPPAPTLVRTPALTSPCNDPGGPLPTARILTPAILAVLALALAAGLTSRWLRFPPPLPVTPGPGPVELYRPLPAGGAGPLLSPFHLHVDPMEGLLLVNFEGDPDRVYVGFEPQVFDDEVHGRGMLVIGWRVDGRVDVYHQPSLRLDPATYSIAGRGLANLVERPLEGARLAFGAAGVDAWFAFEDLEGRPVEVTVRETAGRPRKPFGLLAPMGEAATAPDALPLVLLHDFYFVRRRGAEVEIRVDGELRTPDRLPVPVDGSRMYFLRYSPAPFIVTWNPAHDGPLAPLRETGIREARDGEVTYELLDNQGRTEIASMRRRRGPHEVVVDFEPALPHLAELRHGARAEGRFLVRGHSSTGVVSGVYRVQRDEGEVRLEVHPSGGWTPAERKWSVRLMYRVVPTFREWPTTYRWEATVDLDGPGGATMRSRWLRTTGDGTGAARDGAGVRLPANLAVDWLQGAASVGNRGAARRRASGGPQQASRSDTPSGPTSRANARSAVRSPSSTTGW
jgi:hypothetical protein